MPSDRPNHAAREPPASEDHHGTSPASPAQPLGYPGHVSHFHGWNLGQGEAAGNNQRVEGTEDSGIGGNVDNTTQSAPSTILAGHGDSIGPNEQQDVPSQLTSNEAIPDDYDFTIPEFTTGDQGRDSAVASFVRELRGVMEMESIWTARHVTPPDLGHQSSELHMQSTGNTMAPGWQARWDAAYFHPDSPWADRSARNLDSAENPNPNAAGAAVDAEPEERVSAELSLLSLLNGTRTRPEPPERAQDAAHAAGMPIPPGFQVQDLGFHGPGQMRRVLQSYTTVPQPPEEECSICREPYDQDKHAAIRLEGVKCKHVFGHSCLTEWINAGTERKHRRCPMCRTCIEVAIGYPDIPRVSEAELLFQYGVPSDVLRTILAQAENDGEFESEFDSADETENTPENEPENETENETGNETGNVTGNATGNATE